MRGGLGNGDGGDRVPLRQATVHEVPKKLRELWYQPAVIEKRAAPVSLWPGGVYVTGPSFAYGYSS